MAITKATPRPIEDGIEDNSQVATPLEREQIPQHCPLFLIQAKKGELKTKFLSGAAMLKEYGADTFNEAKKFYSHQTAALNTAAATGNLVAIRRLADATAKVAGFCLAVEYVTEDITVYERDVNGKYTLDINGNPIPVTPATTVAGYKKRLILIPGITADNYKTQTIKAGTFTNVAGVDSTVVPLISGITGVGDSGNNIGFRIEVPHVDSADPADDFVASDQDTMLYRWTWYERENVKSTPQRINTLLLSRSVDFSFKKGASNPKTNASFDKSRVISQYERHGSGVVPVSGPVSNLHFYEANIDATLELLFNAELLAAAAQGEVSPLVDKQEINLFTDVDFQNREFFGIAEELGGISADSLTTHYLTGGNDGTVDEATLDTLARTFLHGDWDDPDEPLRDWAQYPFSQLYDTGFSLDTKYAFLDAMGERKEIKVDVCTQDLAMVENDTATEISMGQSLRVRALLTPESIIHGTATCRASVWGSVGTLNASLFGKRVPALLDIINKRGNYAGAADGILKPTERFDAREKNSVSIVSDVTHTYKSDDIKNTFWDLGVNYVQYRDRSDLFWAAYQSIYSDDTSVLNGDIAVSVLVDIKKRANYHWAINTGESMSKAEFAKRSDDDFFKLIDGVYDDRFVITYATVFTPADNARGYSWTLNINCAADPARTVGQYNISVSRPE